MYIIYVMLRISGHKFVEGVLGCIIIWPDLLKL